MFLENFKGQKRQCRLWPWLLLILTITHINDRGFVATLPVDLEIWMGISIGRDVRPPKIYASRWKTHLEICSGKIYII